jgi:DNA-binding beta-propeller fold protein YncE
MAALRSASWRFAVLGLCSLVAMACATPEAPRRMIERVWPEPPLTPRIRFLGVLGSDPGSEKSGGGGLTRVLFGTEEPRRLAQPMGIAWSSAGRRAYVTDYAERAVFVFDPERQRLERFGGFALELASPLGIAVDGQDRVYLVDSTPRRILVFDHDGKLQRTITHATLERPTGIAVDAARGRVYVADSARLGSPNHRIVVFDLEGKHLFAFGARGWEHGQFFFPTFLALDREGRLYVADTLNGRVQVFAADGRYLHTIGGPGDTPGTFDKPKAVALDSFGNVYVTDSASSNVQIFNRQGDPLLVFGERGRDEGRLVNPTGIAIDGDNRIYVADAFNGRINIYQLINTRAEDSIVVPRAGAGRE